MTEPIMVTTCPQCGQQNGRGHPHTCPPREPAVPVSRLEELAQGFDDAATVDDSQHESLAAATWRQAAEDIRALITEYQEPQRVR